MFDEMYCYSQSNVLVNVLDIRDQAKLFQAERRLTSIRLAELMTIRMKKDFDFDHLKRIHLYIFQDVYPWAGQVRKTNISKGVMFCDYRFIKDVAYEVFSSLHRENCLQGLSRDELVERFSFFFGEINALHPFREGNGRTQREFFRELALYCGYRLEFKGVSEEQMIEASRASFMKDYSLLKDMFDSGLKSLE
ncbi:MAG: Fic family protein [Clostridia bacterium]|nr:Fic family protein [Clostridia bacterium]